MSGEHCAGCGYLREYHEAGAAGRLGCPGLRTKVFQVPPPIVPVTWQEILARGVVSRLADVEPVIRPAQVAPRLAEVPDEVASYRGQARGLADLAERAGGRALLEYGRWHDGSEGSCVKLAVGTRRAVAVWQRPAGMQGKPNGWKADVAYRWLIGACPRRSTVTEIKAALTTLLTS